MEEEEQILYEPRPRVTINTLFTHTKWNELFLVAMQTGSHYSYQ